MVRGEDKVATISANARGLLGIHAELSIELAINEGKYPGVHQNFPEISVQ